MGEFRFRLPDDWRLTSRQATTIHIVGVEGIPWPVRISTESDDRVFVVSRNRDESGKLYIAYPFPELGEIVVCTGSLPERDQTYDLITELARGNLNRLRTQISVWQEGGLKIHSEIHAGTEQATILLGQSILSGSQSGRDESAKQSLIQSMKVILRLARDFGEQVCRFRTTHADFTRFKIGFDAGCPKAGNLGPIEKLAARNCFETLELSTGWLTSESDEARSLLQTAESSGAALIAGPVLDASPGGMNADLIDLDDFEARRTRILSECRSVLASLPKKTAILHVASGLNGLGHRHLSYPQQLQLTSDLLQLVEDCGIEIPNLLSFDFPWAERMATSVGGIHPLQIADTLLRQGLRISYLGMDVNLDYFPGGSVIRDPFQWIDLIDVWSQLGLPLIISLRVPTGSDTSSYDVDAEQDTDPGGMKDSGPSFKKTRRNEAGQIVHKQRSNMTPEMRLDLLSQILPVVFARPTVHGLILRQLTDEQDCRFPGAGIIDSDGSPREIVSLIEKLNGQYLTGEV